MLQKALSFLLIFLFLFESVGQAQQTNATTNANVPDEVLITEICTDPQQDWSTNDFNGIVAPGGAVTSSDEYIEIFNASSRSIDLTGWHLIMTDSASDDAVITPDLVKNEQPAGDISHFLPGTYLILGNPLGSMNNDVQVELYDGPNISSTLINKVTLGNYDDGNTLDNAPDGDASSSANEVVARHKDNHTGDDGKDFFKAQASIGTVSAEINHAPIAEISTELEGEIGYLFTFDASGSTDEDGDPLTFSWDFGAAGGISSHAEGQIVTHAFSTPGTVAVTVQAIDPSGAVGEAHIMVTITPKEFSKEIRLNELFFLSKTEDKNFIELFNTGAQPIDISKWIIRNEDVQKEFIIPEQTVIESQTYTIFFLKTIGLPIQELNQITLLNPNRDVVSEMISGTGGKEGESTNVSPQGWAWSNTPTPGSANIIKRSSGDIIDWPSFPQAQSGQSSTLALTAISKARTLPKQTAVRIRGIVSVLPGEFSDSYFFMQDAGAGLKISSSKKEFPKLWQGDIVEVEGKISPTTYDVSLAASSTNAIQIKGHAANTNLAVMLNLEQISDAKKGLLVRVQGEFVKQTSAYITLTKNGKNVRIKKEKLSIQGAIPTHSLISISGILTKDSSGFMIMPRSKSDIGFGPSATRATASKSSAQSTDKLIASGIEYDSLFTHLLQTAVARLKNLALL